MMPFFETVAGPMITMSDSQPSPDELLDLIGDGLVRRIVLLTDDAPKSADQLANELGVSRTTVYRRVNALVEYNLLRQNLETGSDGHHYRTFEPALNEISFRIDDGDFRIAVEVDEDLVDKLDGFLGGLEKSYSHVNVGTDEGSEKGHPGGDTHYG